MWWNVDGKEKARENGKRERYKEKRGRERERKRENKWKKGGGGETEEEKEGYWTFSTEWSLKKRGRAIYAMPTCCDETSGAETAAATRGEKKEACAMYSRNYSDDNATLRMHPKRTDEASEFQKPLLTEIRLRGIAFPFLYIPLFCDILPIPFLPSPSRPYLFFSAVTCRTVRPATCVALFSKWKCTYTVYPYVFRVRTYCMLDRVTKWTQVRGDGEEVHQKVVCRFYSRSR